MACTAALLSARPCSVLTSIVLESIILVLESTVSIISGSVLLETVAMSELLEGNWTPEAGFFSWSEGGVAGGVAGTWLVSYKSPPPGPGD